MTRFEGGRFIMDTGDLQGRITDLMQQLIFSHADLRVNVEKYNCLLIPLLISESDYGSVSCISSNTSSQKYVILTLTVISATTKTRAITSTISKTTTTTIMVKKTKRKAVGLT